MIKQIKGFVQHYAWGGYHFLPSILSIDNNERKPFAELWFGDHSGGTSPLIRNHQKEENLRQFIDLNPTSLLGEKTYIKDGGRPPFLLKILDVHKMLSIQAHPSKSLVKAWENAWMIEASQKNNVYLEPVQLTA
jgi:mannose-6-phosphate isomerase